MKKLLNTLYITTPDTYLSLDGENIVLLKEKTVLGRVPLHNLENIVTFGYRGASPALMGACAEKNIGLTFMTMHGRFLARIAGPVCGNVLLRTEQYRIADDPVQSIRIGRNMILGKVYNSKRSLERTLHDHTLRVDTRAFENSILQLKQTLPEIKVAGSQSELMGLEGLAAKAYFSCFDNMILKNKNDFQFHGRSRRPPMDAVNAMLSLAYTLLGNEIANALESVGLDPAVGVVHSLRPGRNSLALDMLEELRAPLADRFVLSQINLGTVTKSDFQVKENGAVYMSDTARKLFLTAWQKRKQETIMHPFLKEKVQWGMIPYTQSMLLARHIRGDLDEYPPFFWK